MPGQGYDWKSVEVNWQSEWERSGIFLARADKSKPKFFANVPYPYLDALLHVGQGVTFLHADIMARYKRMRGYNVLFPQAFHCTGLPILGAAKRVKEKEAVQLNILRSMDIPENQVSKFANPLHWIEVFPAETQKDLRAFGAGVDWSRTFYTTDQNPPYDAFVKWQFRKLRDGGYLRLGKHPVIWCPTDQIPIGDHDRYEGEGEVPLEFTLLKFKLKQRYVMAASLRPETVFGTTNVWVDPEVEYVEVMVDGERWIVNPSAAEKLKEQGREVKILDRVLGSHLVGQSCIVPLVGDPVPILPSRFIDQTIGTGIVSSVPSDAPDDLVALRELQSDDKTLKRFQLDLPFVKALDPISIINVEGFGPLPAEDVVKRMGIESQMDRANLEKAKEEVYRTEYYKGSMNSRCGDFAGMRVDEAKDAVKRTMLGAGEADVLFEPSGPVVCRCLTRAIVKVVEDQWFLAYGDEGWKEKVHEALASMALYPEGIRKQFDHVIDWLNDWASTHHQGLGTRLPWDDNWVIESLSDSTIYMAYYTVAHVLQSDKVDPSKLHDELFDYIFLGEGTAKEVARSSGIEASLVEEMRDEFSYWYPFDLRQSGKDLVPNHLSFCLFNHVAVFPSDRWPLAFGVNGMLSVAGQKMSKSKGGALWLRRALEHWGADATRITLAQGGEGLDDPTFDESFAHSVGTKLGELLQMSSREWDTSEEWTTVESWFRSRLQRAIRSTMEAMEAMLHRTALKHCFFDLAHDWAWYLRRRGGVPNRTLLAEYLKVQAKLLAPFAPHLAEEMWHTLGGDGYIQVARYPEASEEELDPKAEALEEFLRSLLEDVRQILRATGLVPKRVVLYTSPSWKRSVYREAVQLRKGGEVDVGALVKRTRALPEARGHDAELPAYCRSIIKTLMERGAQEVNRVEWTSEELNFLRNSLQFAARELQAKVELYEEGEEGIDDPLSKARQSMPWRPAIYVE